MVNNFTNINKTNYNLSPQINEHKKIKLLNGTQPFPVDELTLMSIQM